MRHNIDSSSVHNNKTQKICVQFNGPVDILRANKEHWCTTIYAGSILKFAKSSIVIRPKQMNWLILLLIYSKRNGRYIRIYFAMKLSLALKLFHCNFLNEVIFFFLVIARNFERKYHQNEQKLILDMNNSTLLWNQCRKKIFVFFSNVCHIWTWNECLIE